MDLNGNGHSDILSGSYSRMEQPMAGLFQVLWGQPDGTFQKAAVLNGTDNQPLVIPVEGDNWTESICTRPFAVDWDGDGNLDLVVGNFSGTFYLFKGEGKGKFRPEPEQLMVGNGPLKIDGYHSDPFVIDWDGDGDLDLLSGSSQGGVQWAENTAGPGQPPRFESFRPLIEAGPQVAYGESLRDADLKGPVGSTRVWAADVNGNGKLDLLVGDLVTLITPAAELSEPEMKKKLAEWQQSVNEAVTQVNLANADEQERAKAQQRFQELYNQRNQFMKEDRTGFVWLYPRK